MPFRWTINPYRGCSHACTYCFARPTHTYLDFDAGRDFEREIVVKVNTPELARAELMRPRWKREHVALGTNTDPYQWVEKRYRLLPGVWEAMRDSGTPCSVLTKSPLLLRDAELFKQIPELHGQPVGAHARREGLARQRAAHAAPAQAARGGGGAQPRRDPVRRPDRAADARDQRRSGAGRADPRALRRGGRRERRRDLPAPPRGGERGSSWTGYAPTGPTSSRATRRSTRAAPTRPDRARAPFRARSVPRARRSCAPRPVASPQTPSHLGPSSPLF